MLRILNILIGSMAIIVSVWGNAASARETITVNGSTTVLPIAQDTAEAYILYHPDVNISVSGGGSGNGLKALVDGTTQIATSSRQIKKEEEKLAASKGVKPIAHAVAIDAIVPIVHPENPVSDLSIEQLSLIYQGKIRNWKELGGKDMKIVVTSRDTSSGTYGAWQEKVLHRQRVAPTAQLQASSGAIVQIISKNRYAIGYIGISYLNKSIKALTVNGIEGNEKNALSGKYPIARPLYMYTAGTPKGAVADYIKFVTGPEGQKIVQKQGFVRIK